MLTIQKDKAMLFKDIKPNYPIYILDKSTVEIFKGKVTQASFPHPESQSQQTADNYNRYNYNIGQSPFSQSNSSKRTVIDLTIEANGRSATYEVGENASVNYAGNLVIATEQSLLVPEVEAIRNNSEQALAPERMEQLKKSLEKSKALLSEISPEFKQQQEYDARFNKLEGSVDELKDMMKNFIKEFKS